MMVIAIVIVENDGGIITEESEFFAISIIDSTGIIDRAREGNGIGGAVPIHRQAKGVGNGAYRQIGGAIDDEGSHNRAVGIFGGNERAIETVSYTHLDVYKRQSSGRAAMMISVTSGVCSNNCKDQLNTG